MNTHEKRSTRRRGSRRLARRGGAGFTLIEILLALGILAFALSMVAAVFPVAILQAKQADRTTMDTLIAENALAVIKATARHSTFATVGTTMVPVVLQNGGGGLRSLHVDDTRYPIGDDESRYGWVALVRQSSPGANDYQFVVIPYEKSPGVNYGAKDYPTLVSYSGVSISGTTASFSQQSDMAIGSPLVRADGGGFTFIVGIENNTAILAGNLGSGTVWVLHHTSSTGGGRSPALGCMMFRLSLQP